MSYNVDYDITIEFYYKYASYKSPASGAVIDIKIKKVYVHRIVSKKYPYWERQEVIISDQGIEYDKKELHNFRINQ